MKSVYIIVDKRNGSSVFVKCTNEEDVLTQISFHTHDVQHITQVFEDGTTKQLTIEFDGKLKLVEKKKKEDNVKLVMDGTEINTFQALPVYPHLHKFKEVLTPEEADEVMKDDPYVTETITSDGSRYVDGIPVLPKKKPKMNVIVLADVVGNLKTAHREAYDVIEKLFYKKIAEKGYDINLVSRRALKDSWSTEVHKLDPFPVQSGQESRPAWISGIEDARHLLSNKKDNPTAVLLLSGGKYYTGDTGAIKGKLKQLASDVDHVQLYEFGSGYGHTFYSVVGDAVDSPELRRKIQRNFDNDFNELYSRNTLYFDGYLKDAKN